MLDQARAALASSGADPEDLVFVPNATAGVNTVLRSCDSRATNPVTDHEYNACRNALNHLADQGARVVVAKVPFPAPAWERFLEPFLIVSQRAPGWRCWIT